MSDSRGHLLRCFWNAWNSETMISRCEVWRFLECSSGGANSQNTISSSRNISPYWLHLKNKSGALSEVLLGFFRDALEEVLFDVLSRRCFQGAFEVGPRCKQPRGEVLQARCHLRRCFAARCHVRQGATCGKVSDSRAGARTVSTVSQDLASPQLFATLRSCSEGRTEGAGGTNFRSSTPKKPEDGWHQYDDLACGETRVRAF